MNTEELFEILSSAQYNFETFEKQNPQIKQHPIYMIAKSQLDEAILVMASEEDPSASTPQEEKLDGKGRD